MLSPLPRRSDWGTASLIPPAVSAFPGKGSRVGLRIVLFEACSAFTRVTACTLALSPYFVTRLPEGFSHFVTSIAAPVASGWSGCRVGLAPTGKRRLITAHTLCCPSSSPRQRQQCSGSGHSRPQRGLTVSATFRSSSRQRDRDADDRSQGSADVARRMCVARWFPERQLNRCRGHWASKTNRMSAAHGAGLTHPTHRRRRRFSDRLTGVPCHRPFVALVAKMRIQ